MPRSAVRVVIRTRPTSNIAKDMIHIDSSSQSIDVTLSKRRDADYVSNQPDRWSFRFDNIMHNASQDAVYDTCAQELGKGLIEGLNGTVIAYGQTGAGKTFTMLGPGTDSFKYRGIIPRMLTDVFKEIGNRPQTTFIVRCSYLEIYNEQLADLLNQDKGQNLMIVEDDAENIVVKGLSKHVIESEEDGLRLLFLGESRRKVAEHQYNKASSRSHCIFTLYVEATSKVESNARVTVSKLNMVDLAGSERVKKSLSAGAVLREAKFINKSLSFLEQVVIALAAKKRREHIPYRQSRLTNVLKDTLGSNAKIVLIANVFVEGIHMEETLSTLKFASRMMLVEQEAKINVSEDAGMKAKRYERVITELRSELAMHDALVSRSHVAYDPYTEEQRYELGKQVRAYAMGELDEIEVASVRHMKEIMLQFKQLVQNLQAELIGQKDAPIATPTTAAPVKEKKREADAGDTVGTLEGSGFGVGMAPSTAKPKSMAKAHRVPETPPTRAARPPPAPTTPVSEEMVQPEPEPEPVVPPPMVFKSRDDAFEDFKKDPSTTGPSITLQLNDQKLALKQGKEAVKSLGVEVNTQKKRIDELSRFISSKKASHQGGVDDEEVIDEEEYEALKELGSVKKQYRSLFEELATARRENTNLQQLIDELRNRLVQEFDSWYSEHYPPPALTGLAGLVASDSSVTRLSTVGGDVMDYGEHFDTLEMQRIVADDPESSAFFSARKGLVKGGRRRHR